MSASETALAATSASAWMPRPLLSDARLVRLAGRGDQRAFEAIFKRYHQELYRYCRGDPVRDPDEAQDALQSHDGERAPLASRRGAADRPSALAVPGGAQRGRSRFCASAPTSWTRRVPDPTAAGADFEAEARRAAASTRRRTRSAARAPAGRPRSMRELSGLSYAEIGNGAWNLLAAARQAVYEARMALQGPEPGARNGV